MVATNETVNTTNATNTTALAGGVERERIFSWLGLAFPLAVSAILNLWNLAQNGYSNLYYSVAVQSMLQNFHNFFFATYDAGGFIMVDKPPVALWMQAISARIFGFSSLSLLVPEALAGVASVGLVYFLVRRLFGTLAGFVAAMTMAITPIAVAVERTNGVDTWLMFTLLLAAWAMTPATEKGHFALLALGLALAGVAFNTKMLAAFVVLPTFYLLYLVAAPLHWSKRLLHLALGTIVVFGVALSWPLAVDLTPAAQRPWVGGSQANSVLDLALNYNGLGRVTGNEGQGGFRGAPPGGQPGFGGNNRFGPPGGFTPPGGFVPGGNGGPGGGRAFGGPGGPGGGGGMFGAGFAGPLRLFFGGELAEQWSWLFPLAALGLLAAILALRRKLPLEPRGQAILLWVGWLGTYAAVFSSAQGIFHPYYLIMLAPPMAALVGIGVAALWTAYRNGGWQAWLLPVALLATAFWQNAVLVNYPQWAVWLVPLTFGGSLVAAVPLAGVRLMEQQVWRRLAPGLVGVGLIAVMVSPLVWSVTPVLASPNNASLPVAGPSVLTDGSTSWTTLKGANSSPLASFLEANRDGYFYLVAVTNSQQASSLALETGDPVLAMGGFMGSDPAMTVEKLQEMIATKQVRFIMAGGIGGRGMFGGSSVSSWVQTNCTPVDPNLYGGGDFGSAFPGGPGGFNGGNQQLYSCAANY